MAKISKTHHVTKKGTIKRNPTPSEVYVVVEEWMGEMGVDADSAIYTYSSFSGALSKFNELLDKYKKDVAVEDKESGKEKEDFEEDTENINRKTGNYYNYRADQDSRYGISIVKQKVK